VPPSYYRYLRSAAIVPYDEKTKKLWEEASQEAQTIELGTVSGDNRLNEGLRKHLNIPNDDWVLIGGPPCQAYSLAGRSRNKGIKDYRPEEDKRHFLYREYLKILADYKPAAFVMENVKGILSSRVDNTRIFPQILRDLSAPSTGHSGVRYRIHSLVTDEAYFPGDDPEALDPRQFIIRAENYGIPQARHRVILVGIREDGPRTPRIGQLVLAESPMPLQWALQSLPPLRSGLSRGDRDVDVWKAAVKKTVLARIRKGIPEHIAKRMNANLDHLMDRPFPDDRGNAFVSMSRLPIGRATIEKDYLSRIQSTELGGVPNHFARGHMPEDLARYMFASTYAEDGQAPKASDFPKCLAPDHKNWSSGDFSDRFRVQLWGTPSTTVTSHISKDGHYFIHPDASQCRSLTVREAARLQTFPDDYFFEGNRTQQYVQVGNAVPPILAEKIASIVYEAIS
jgi:DNA (cytosine-5)-methyltransferase 1